MLDNINKPNYYTWHPAIECFRVSQEFTGNLAQAIQYIWRNGNPDALKNPDTQIDDLRKAIKFLEFEIDRRLSHLSA